jgi:hypothetical protein
MKRGRKKKQSFLKLHFVIHNELPWVNQRRDVLVEYMEWSAMYWEFSYAVGQGIVTD